jgi:hypothetical protein
MPNAFRVTLEHVPGSLAKLAGALGERGINIEASAGETLGGEGRITLLTSDPEATRGVLTDQRFPFEEVELLVTTLEDRPGALAQLAKNLAAVRVNVTGLVQLSRAEGRTTLGFVVDDADKARPVLEAPSSQG